MFLESITLLLKFQQM